MPQSLTLSVEMYLIMINKGHCIKETTIVCIAKTVHAVFYLSTLVYLLNLSTFVYPSKRNLSRI